MSFETKAINKVYYGIDIRKTLMRFADYLVDNYGVPKGIRTPVAAVKGQCPRPG